MGFVRSYFRTGRPWLLWSFVAVQGLILVLTFGPGPTFNYREVTAMLPYQFLGETLRSPRGVPPPWEWIGEVGGLLFVGFVVDAAVRSWRMCVAGVNKASLPSTNSPMTKSRSLPGR